VRLIIENQAIGAAHNARLYQKKNPKSDNNLSKDAMDYIWTVIYNDE
jgi:hypothetical protein